MAKQTVRFNMNISPEAAAKLEELAKGTTKTAVIEQSILALYDLMRGEKKA